MNEFDEHTWTPDQIALDGLICREFEALEASPVPDADVVQRVAANIVLLTHAGRQEHWLAELARIGVLLVPEGAAPRQDLEDHLEAGDTPESLAAQEAAVDAVEATVELGVDPAPIDPPRARGKKGG